MRRFFLRLRLFSLLFETAGPPPMHALVQSALTLSAWLGVVFFAPDLPEEMMITIVVAVSILAGPGVRTRLVRERLRHQGVSGLILIPIVAVVWGLVFFAPDPVWIQRLCTLAPLLFAFACLVDILDGQGTFGGHWWPNEKLAPARGTLVRAFFLKHLAFAILNETLIAMASISGWLVWLAVLPVLHHFVNTALTTTVLIDVEESR